MKFLEKPDELVALEEVAGLFGLSYETAKRYAPIYKLPVPAFRLSDSIRAPWWVNKKDLQLHFDKQRETYNELWKDIH